MKLIVVVVSFNVVLATTALAQFQRPNKNGLVSNNGAGVGRVANPRVAESYGKLPLSFEANQGQTDSKVKFLSRCSGYSLFLTSNEAVLSLRQSRDRKGAVTPATDKTAVLRMKLVGANLAAAVTGLEELPGKSNYFIGTDPKKWRANVPTYAKVRYANIYSGIDLVYYGNQRQLEYDFVVAPGADSRTIRLAIDGDEKLRIDGQGDLVLGAKGGELRLHRPVIYQEINGSRQPIGGNFVIKGMPSEASAKKGGHQVGFEVARYDASKPLVIDPVLSYSTYIGGASEDLGYGIAVDSSGSAYVTGSTGPDFPTAGPFQAGGGGRGLDAFVTKLNDTGSALVYSTYLGGIGDERGFGIAVDSFGNAFVTGFTTSVNFPTTANAFQAAAAISGAFVAKLDATGSTLVYSTYLGGSDGAAGQGIAVDSFGSAYVTGTTNSSNFPTVNAFQPAYGGNYDAFVTKLNADGSALVYSTYLGGSSDDYGQGIAVDSSGNAYVTGTTSSSNFPTANAFQAAYGGGGQYDAFVTKLNAMGSQLVYSTYLGGSSDEGGLGIAVDSSGNAYVTGTTNSTDFPTANALQAAYGGGGICGTTDYNFPCNDAFVTKLNDAGSALVYSTYLGGNNEDAGRGIAVDTSGNAYVTGTTSSSNFPTANAFQAAYGGGEYDAFVTKFNAMGSALVYSTYLGGDDEDSAHGIAVDSSGNAYVTGTAGPDFPTANAFQAAFGGSYDAFVTKFQVPGTPTVRIVDNNTGSLTTLAVGDSFSFLVTGAPPVSLVFVSEPGWSASLGYTDSSGSFRLSGTVAANVVGTWQQTWTIGGVVAQPSPLQFTVTQP